LDKEWLYKTDSSNSWVEEAKYACFGSLVVDASESQSVLIEQTGAEVTAAVVKKKLTIKNVDEAMKLVDSFGGERQEEEVVTQSEGLFGGLHFSCVGFSLGFVSDWNLKTL
jgi:hypothetical protein